MLFQPIRQLSDVRGGVLDGGDGLVCNPQLFPAAGALPVVDSGVFLQALDKAAAVMDKDRAKPYHLGAEFRQGVQKAGMVLGVPQNPGLLFMGAAVGGQGRGVTGPELAEGSIQKASPYRRSLPDQVQVLRLKEHRGIDVHGAAGFHRSLVHGKPPPPSPGQIRLNPKIPVPCENVCCQPCLFPCKADHFPVVPGPWRTAP